MELSLCCRDEDPVISNMVLIEVDLQTGKKYKKESANLEDFERAGVTKIEEDPGKVTLYFEVNYMTL